MRQTLEQKRAKYAMDAVNKQKEGEDPESYGRHVRRMPAMILNNGLGQALAFLLADAEGEGKTPSMKLYKDIETWLCGSESDDYPRRIYGNGDLIQLLMQRSRHLYIHAQNETLSLLRWMTKFADAYLPKARGG
jgi:CRISPR-associated protein Cmr5